MYMGRSTVQIHYSQKQIGHPLPIGHGLSVIYGAMRREEALRGCGRERRPFAYYSSKYRPLLLLYNRRQIVRVALSYARFNTTACGEHYYASFVINTAKSGVRLLLISPDAPGKHHPGSRRQNLFRLFSPLALVFRAALFVGPAADTRRGRHSNRVFARPPTFPRTGSFGANSLLLLFSFS